MMICVYERFLVGRDEGMYGNPMAKERSVSEICEVLRLFSRRVRKRMSLT